MKRIRRIKQYRAIESAKKEEKKYTNEKKNTLELLKCFKMTESQIKYFEENDPNEIRDEIQDERNFTEIEIEKQKKYTSDFRLNIIGVFATIITVILTVVIFMYGNSLTQMNAINEEIAHVRQEQRDAQHEFAKKDEATKEKDAKETQAFADDNNEQLSQLYKQADSMQANIIVYWIWITFLLILVFLAFLSSVYVFQTFLRNNKRSAIILVAYKKRLEFLDSLIKQKEVNKSIKNKTDNILELEELHKENRLKPSFAGSAYKDKLKNKY